MTEEAKIYRSVFGFVAFDPEDGEGKDGTPFLRFRMSGGNLKEQPLVSVTVWGKNNVSNFKELEPGDFVAVHGVYKQAMSDGRVYHNVTARSLVRIPNVVGYEPPDTSSTEKSSELF